ncbi:hypothetical protein KC19_9G133900 [Ceratodon purpureus]|uniref:Uncharacterized protein n=1 Tax=Ceratodon purpureus TaxID=3225 RepID=A0A8T0GRK7_CERPU|nr:hypothetical protein KC19_9G133900 [Ceratodon purpureus]
MGVEALCSSKFVAPNAAVQHILPSPVVIDLIFRDGGISPFAKRSAKVARVASRGWNILKSLRRRNKITSSNSNPTPRSSFGSNVTPGSALELPSSRNSESFICRANSFEQSGVPEREDAEEFRGIDNSGYGPERGFENQLDAGTQGLGQDAEINARMQRSMVSVKYGAANSEVDRFRRSSSPDFCDEFFTRMMALEASHIASPRVSDLRACSTSTAAFLDAAGADATLNAASDIPRPSPGQGVESPGDSTSTHGKEQGSLCALGMGGVQLPPSIKKLRRRNSDVKGENRALPRKEPGCAIRNAFSSMVYMIKVVQSHALQIRQVLFSEWDVQEVLLLVHREMHSSFVWLFQQVFACTPKLMVSVMILLANFTVYSMGENVAIATVTETPAPIAFFLSTYGNPQASLDPNFTIGSKTYSIPFSKQPMASPHLDALGAGSGGNNFSSPSTAESFDGDSWLSGALNQRYMFSQKDSIHSPAPAAEAARRFQESVAPKNIQPEQRPSHQEMMKAWVESSMKDLRSGEPLQQMQLEQETIRRLVAPVVAHLESDNYACFDRTDLEYQHALSKDQCNPLLLANYAQFLYVVRHENDRAEGYFHQAMQADPMDSTILGRFASFLWLGRGNRAAAERAYKAAIAADPESSFPAGNYAHFLWHAGDGDSYGPPGSMTV